MSGVRPVCAMKSRALSSTHVITAAISESLWWRCRFQAAHKSAWVPASLATYWPTDPYTCLPMSVSTSCQWRSVSYAASGADVPASWQRMLQYSKQWLSWDENMGPRLAHVARSVNTSYHCFTKQVTKLCTDDTLICLGTAELPLTVYAH